jgi:cardiolipin synthase
MEEKIINVPNLLSFYRLLTFPFLIWMILTNQENLFAIFLCINLITDILDGLIARIFKLETKFGAKLDSLADLGMIICALFGVFTFKQEELGASIHLLWPFLLLFALGMIISFIKFRQGPSLHLYSSKIGGYVQGIYFFILFAWLHVPWLYFIAIGFGYWSWFEEIIVLLKLKEPRSNVKGIYWILKEGTKQGR